MDFVQTNSSMNIKKGVNIHTARNKKYLRLFIRYSPEMATFKELVQKECCQGWANLDQAHEDLDRNIFRDLSPTPKPWVLEVLSTQAHLAVLSFGGAIVDTYT